MVIDLNGEWLLATDANNEGREGRWWRGPASEARPAKVPWIIQATFPGYHGVAWYWREFQAPRNPHEHGRYLLRFGAVDYLAEVWLNGTPVGGHEGGETPFVLDVTDVIEPNAANLLAVRVLNPTNEPIDGIVLSEMPHRNKAVPFRAGASYNCGGITGSVELLIAPAVRLDDVAVRADPATGRVTIRASITNSASRSVRCRVGFAVGPVESGETLARSEFDRDILPGEGFVEADLAVERPRMWRLQEPFLYRATARVASDDPRSADERSARCGFRDFRFADGYFRLNGERIFLRGSHTVNHAPIGQELPHDPDLFRRDLLNVKVMGFNMIRFIAGMAKPHQLDLCDEIGLLVYEESYAAWLLGDSPEMAGRFDRSVAEMIRRDRNHPSVVMWGLLNETEDGPVFRHAVEALALVRTLDADRVVMLNSGRWDGRMSIGSLSNPRSGEWEHHLGAEAPGAPPTKSTWGGYFDGAGDAHAYPRVPHTAETIRFLRTLGHDTKPVFLSEYGIGSAVDLWRVVRHYERLGAKDAEDAVYYRDRLDEFMADWERWRLEEMFPRPSDYFAACVQKMAGQRTLSLNALRANPRLVGHGVTGTLDQGLTGEGLFTTFRELKPGATDALFDGLAPLRLCLFAEPVHAYRGQTVRFEAVLANEDALPPGTYPIRLDVVGPDDVRVLERTISVTIPERSQEPPFAQTVFAENVPIEGPPGAYRFLAEFVRGAAAAGGRAAFFVSDPNDLPAMENDVVLWGDDARLAAWLADYGVPVRPFDPAEREKRAAILISGAPPAPGGAGAFRDLVRRIAAGSTAIFLSPDVFKRGDDPVGWLPLEKKGAFTTIRGWLYLKDEWAKRGAVFEGLPSGGLMDYDYYREIIPDRLYCPSEPPQEAVAGAIRTSQDYSSGLMLAVYGLGAGRMILNTLLIRENLGRHPAADRLLVNMVRYAGREDAVPPARLSAEAEDRLFRAIGY